MIRVAFFIGDGSWKGGVNYYRNLLCALETVKNGLVSPVLVTTLEPGDTEALPTRLLECEMLHYRKPQGRYLSIANNKFRHWFDIDIHLTLFLKKHGIDMVSHDTGDPKTTIPTLCWIPDFQHVKRPEFFQPEMVQARIESHKKQCRKAVGIIVSSNDALNDLLELCSVEKSKVAVLRFVAPAAGDYIPGRDEILRKYNLRAPYFHVPNQFWKHKNHTLLLKALSELKSKGNATQIVCTGSTEDHRHPEYYNELMAMAHSLGVDDVFTVLGLVPYDDVMSLVRHSAAVINPSYFEGWSSTVEESKSMGKRILLSSIPVHLEQAPARGAYFSPDAPGELADLMQEVLVSYDPGEEDIEREKAYADFLKRQKEYGQAYHDHVVDCADRNH